MKKEKQKQLTKITDISKYPRNEKGIEFTVNGKSIYISTQDEKILQITDKLNQEDISSLENTILSNGANIYYPNFKNQMTLDEKGEFQFVNRDTYFMMFQILLGASSVYTKTEIEDMNGILNKLKSCHFDVYNFNKFQKVFSILMYIDFFYSNYPQEQRAMAIATIQIANTYARAEDDGDLIDMEYIFHCAGRNNYAHIGDYLKKELLKILEEIYGEVDVA